MLDEASYTRKRYAGAMIACIIRYQIDPFQRDEFRTCGGHLIGYFLPSEGTNDIAWGSIAFPNFAAYEVYREWLKADLQGRDNFEFARTKRLILREERNFVEIVDGTFNIEAV